VKTLLPGFRNCSAACSRCETIFDLPGKEQSLKHLEQQSAAPDFWNDTRRAQDALKQMKSLKTVIDPWNRLHQEISENLELAELLTDDDEHAADLKSLEQITDFLEHQIDDLEFRTLLSEETDVNNCYLYIHPGAGGTESCDWANMLMRMYLRWCEDKGYETQLVDLQPGDEAGIKSATLYVKGDYAYGYLKAESGVHRLVRISPFDANKRRHTSFASVFVSPEVDENIEVEIKESDLRIDTFRSSGAGGQHVNVTDSAVRITHLPTRIVVQCQNERSQHKNRAMAMKVLRSRLYQYYLEKQREEQAVKEGEKKDIAWGSQIRSYVFQPYTMVKDHRTNVETSNVQEVMDGHLDPFIQSYLRQKRT
jgi:peptide chain release factor 2